MKPKNDTVHNTHFLLMRLCVIDHSALVGTGAF